jgi:hypothetical protein
MAVRVWPDIITNIVYFHNRNFFMRMNLSDCIIPFGGISYLGINGPENLKTTHNFWLDFGIGIRF